MCVRVLLKLNPFTTGIIIVLIQHYQKSVIIILLIFSEQKSVHIRTINVHTSMTKINKEQCSHINDYFTVAFHQGGRARTV